MDMSPYPLYKTYIQFLGLSDNKKSDLIQFTGLNNEQLNDLISLIQNSLESLKQYECNIKLMYHLRMSIDEINKLNKQQKEYYIYFLEKELKQNKNSTI